MIVAAYSRLHKSSHIIATSRSQETIPHAWRAPHSLASAHLMQSDFPTLFTGCACCVILQVHVLPLRRFRSVLLPFIFLILVAYIVVCIYYKGLVMAGMGIDLSFSRRSLTVFLFDDLTVPV